jgi:hypothetical protein
MSKTLRLFVLPAPLLALLLTLAPSLSIAEGLRIATRQELAIAKSGLLQYVADPNYEIVESSAFGANPKPVVFLLLRVTSPFGGKVLQGWKVYIVGDKATIYTKWPFPGLPEGPGQAKPNESDEKAKPTSGLAEKLPQPKLKGFRQYTVIVGKTGATIYQWDETEWREVAPATIVPVDSIDSVTH